MDTKKTLCKIGRKMKEAGLVAACDGNISFRRADGTIVITPSGVPKGEVKPSDLLILDANGKLLKGKGKPSSETALHVEVYKARPDVQAIIHAHPIVATAVTVAGLPFPSSIVTEGSLVLGPVVPTVPYAAPGSQELAAACAEYAKKVNVFLMERHGASALGKDLNEALNRMETLEAVAKVYRASLAFAVNTHTLEEIKRTQDLASLLER